jgi:hypothetical protein
LMCVMTFNELLHAQCILSMSGDDEDLLAFLQSFGFADEDLNRVKIPEGQKCYVDKRVCDIILQSICFRYEL